MRSEQLLHRTIAGYDLIDILGRGGMSIVFLAQRLNNPQEQAAMKILTPSTLSTEDEFAAFQVRFLREAQTVHQLQHAHILPILDYGETEDGLFYMLMPVISGGNLTRRLASNTNGLPLAEIAGYLEQLTSAVDYSNQQGMVHRDIKPSNVLLTEDNTVYLADFGIMRVFDSSHLALDDAPPTLTSTGKLFGTPAYMAPERFKGEPAEPATDIYALGILLYQLVTGKVPFEADNPLAIGLKHLSAEPLRPRALRPDLPAPAEAAILKAIMKQPTERFATASALSGAFHAGIEGKWAEELLPFAAVLAAGPFDAQIQQPGASSPAFLSEDAHTHRFITDPAPEATMNNLPFPPLTAAPPLGPARREPTFGRNLQAFTLGMLVIVLLVFGGLIALTVYTLEAPASPPPGLSTPGTIATSTPTRTHTTPTSVTGVTPTPNSQPTATAGRTATPTAGSTPTPTLPPPTPTSPPPTPTSGATP